MLALASSGSIVLLSQYSDKGGSFGQQRSLCILDRRQANSYMEVWSVDAAASYAVHLPHKRIWHFQEMLACVVCMLPWVLY